MHICSHAWVPPELMGWSRSLFLGIYLPLFLSLRAQSQFWETESSL